MQKKSKRIIAIRCITEKSKGFGHLRRCLLLAKELQKNKIKVIFFNKKNFGNKLIKNENFEINIIPKNVSKKNEHTYILQNLQKLNCKVLILDMREYGENLSKRLYKNGIKIMMIDDAWSKYVYSDYLINMTVVKSYQKYILKNRNACLLLGPKYFITNSEFLKNRKKSIRVKPRIFKILITMGGQDALNLTKFIINSISKLTNIKIRVIIGPFFKDVSKSKIKKENINFVYSPEKIWQEFKSVDIVISSAGSTLYELAIQHIPTISIAADKHQVPYGKILKSHGFGYFLGYWKDISPDDIRRALNKVMSNSRFRNSISNVKNL